MAKKLIINRVLRNCEDCIYCSYDPSYNISYDSGYDCSRTGKRIVDDWDVMNSNNPNPKGWPDIPKWCPLEDVDVTDEEKD